MAHDGEHGKQNGHLNQHRQTAAHGVALFFFVQFHGLGRAFFGVFLVLFIDLVHLRLDQLHLSHRMALLDIQRQQDELDDQRKEYDGDTVRTDPAVKQVDNPAKRRDDEIHFCLFLRC